MSSVTSPETHRSWASSLDQPLVFARLNLEVIAWVGLVIVSMIAHFWGLERMALHHDESIHAWMSWKFFTGQGGGFICANKQSFPTYCYDPVYHGPSLYVLTLLSYFLFGDGDAQARFPQALAGVLLVASAWWLRPYLGRRGAFIAAVLLALSPTILYFTRFARHDGLIILFTFWMVIGFFRYLDTGRPGFFYLFMAGTALAVATHELYYILFFLFGSFVGIRLLNESRLASKLSYLLSGVVLLAVLVELSIILRLWGGQLTPTLRADGIALLFLTVALSGLFLTRLWDDHPYLTERLATLWYDQRAVLWRGLMIFGTIYVLLYSTFLAYPLGLLGPYQGLAYWLGSQQDFKRGDQPWYYYLMQMSIYEPLGFFGSLLTMILVFARRGRPWRELFALKRATPATQESALAETQELPESGDVNEIPETNTASQIPQVAGVSLLQHSSAVVAAPTVSYFPLFLIFWFIGALVAFSWAGEKMPWLTIHIALPANLLVAWALGNLTRLLPSEQARQSRVWLIAPMFAVMLGLLGVALWRLSSGNEGQAAQASLVQGLIPLMAVGGLIYAMLTVGQRSGLKLSLAVIGLTVAGLLAAYTIRATWLVVYRQPDVPREFLVFVQSAPDVPLIAKDIRELAVNQTRNTRNATDPAGGLSMPVMMDIGDPQTAEGSLSWPFQWYLRDFQRIEGRNATFFQTAAPESFEIDTADGRKPVPVVMVYTPHVTEGTRQALEQNYLKRFDSKLNWWFPEGSKCLPNEPGYKRFYYSASPASQIREECGENVNPEEFGNILSPFLWVLSPDNWSTWGRYLLYRDIPEPLRLDGREIQIWYRRDLAPVASDSADGSANASLRLVAEQVIESGPQNLLDEARGVAVDAQGNVYISDITAHRIQVFNPQGNLIRTIGQFGAGPGELNEPRGLAFDRQGNLYVADTWNARISKFGPDGAFITSWGQGDQDFGGGRRATINNTEADNQARPLGFFGPRSVAIDSEGNVFIADTGNKRIVVTDANGTYLYQWGRAGAEPGAFNEPTSLAFDPDGNLFVADVWNGRVQGFSREENGQMNPLPSVTWRVNGWQVNSYDDPMITASRDQVIVSVPTRNQIVAYDHRGEPLIRWGGKGRDTASINLPSGVAIAPDQTVYVVDPGVDRVLQFRLPRLAPPDATSEQIGQ